LVSTKESELQVRKEQNSVLKTLGYTKKIVALKICRSMTLAARSPGRISSAPGFSLVWWRASKHQGWEQHCPPK